MYAEEALGNIPESSKGDPWRYWWLLRSESKKRKILEDFIYVFIFRERKREEREGNINVWLPLMRPLLGTWPATQACALTGNQTQDPLVPRSALNPLSHTSQGKKRKCLNSEKGNVGLAGVKTITGNN